MTLHIYSDIEQGSDEWLQARCGILTASQIGKLITPTLKVADNDTSRGLIGTLAGERLSGRVDYIHPSADMQRGTLDEPYARELYAEHFAPVEEVGFMTREIAGHTLGYSPDGLVGTNGLIEVKSRRPKTHIDHTLADVVPRENFAQLQAGLLVSGRDWIDYLSYSGGLPLWRKRVFPDPDWQVVIVQALDMFETKAAAVVDAYSAATRGAPVAPFIDHFAEIELKL